MQKEYNITFSINREYLSLMLVTMYSVLKNNADAYIKFYICHHNCFSHMEINTIISKYSAFNKYKNNYEIILLEMSKISTLDFYLNRNLWTNDIFSKIFLPILLPNEDKILHLDVDLIVKGNLANIYNTNLEDKLFLADNVGENYFNVGFLLMNLELLRKENFTSKLIDYIYKNNETEEKAINVIAINKILSLKENEVLSTASYKKGRFIKYFNYNNFLAIHYTGAKPYYIEKANLQFHKKSIKEYYNYAKELVNVNRKIRFNFIKIYAIYLAPIINSFYRRIINLINKYCNTNIKNRNKFIFKHFIKSISST